MNPNYNTDPNQVIELGQRRYYLRYAITIIGITALFYSMFWIYCGHVGISTLNFVAFIFSAILYYFSWKVSELNTLTNTLLTGALLYCFTVNSLLTNKMPILAIYFPMIISIALLLRNRAYAKFWILASFALFIFSLFLSYFHVIEIKISETEQIVINIIQSLSIFFTVLSFVNLFDTKSNYLLGRLLDKHNDILDINDKLKRSQNYKATFYSSISHELRTPLNAIKGITELLTRESSCNTEEKELIDSLSHSSNHLLSLVNDLLDMGSIEEDWLRIFKHDYDLREVLKTSYKLIKYASKEKKIDIKFDISDNLPKYIKGDAHRVSQIVVNLLTNVIKFTNQGVVSLSVTKSKEELQHFLILKMSGTGRVSGQLKGVVLEHFEQTPNTSYRGTGLGLRISKNLVELMGGTIQFDIQESCFYVKIPLEYTEIEEDANNGSFDIETYFQKMKRDFGLLIVDDNRLNLLVTNKLIVKSIPNSRIFTAENGEDALTILKANHRNIDMVLMDLQMPVMDGKEATIKIKQDPQLQHIPIIATTAAVNETEVSNCFEIGMSDYIGKPFDRNSLLLLIKKHHPRYV